MIAPQIRTNTDEELLATPIVSNRSVPKDLTLEYLEKFALDSPASALTERSNPSTTNRSRSKQELTFRFSCADEEPIIVSHSRLPDPIGLSSRSTSFQNDEDQHRNNRRRRRPLSLISSIATLTNSSENDKEKSNDERQLVTRTSQLFVAKDILSCWARDFAVEILRRLNGKTGAFWLLPNTIYQAFFGLHNNRILASKNLQQLSASQELRIQWNRRKKHRNLAVRTRREKAVCVSGLPNQGQTCFLNSVLQSLASLEPFLEYLEGIVEYQEEKEHLYLSSKLSQENQENTLFGGYGRLFFGNRSGRKEAQIGTLSSTFSKELLDLLKGINNTDGVILDEEYENDRTNNRSRGRRRRRKKLNPKALLHKVAKDNPQFSSYGMSEQQDAQELFASLMGVVIHDSELDSSPSDHRLEVSSFVATSRNGVDTQSTKPMDCDIAEPLDLPMTSAFAHFNKNRNEKRKQMPNEHGNGKLSKNSSDLDQIITPVASNEKVEKSVGDEGNILSISELLVRIGSERNKFQAENGSAEKKFNEECSQHYQNNFLEEKKQDSEVLQNTTTTTTPDVLDLRRTDMNGDLSEQKRQATRSENILASGKQRIRSTMSPITPSPLSGWLGSTLQCSKCKHVRPIQNAPFLDIPLVPISVPNYLSRAYQNSTTKPSSPNSSPLPSCSLQACLEVFTSVESVDDVECRSCTIRAEIDRLEEEAMMLKGAVETMERKILKNKKGSGTDARGLESIDETKCLREDLLKVQERIKELETEDPDEFDDSNSSRDIDNNEEEDFFFGATDPRDQMPMQRCKAKKCLLLTRTPSILCCHIQRRYYDPFTGRMEKCVQFVEFPQFLDLSPYCAYGPLATTQWVAGSNPKFQGKANGKHGSIAYQLRSVIEHRGNAFGGHYVSYRQDHTGSWFCISDSTVTPVSWQDVRTCQAYMLFYEAL